MVASGIYSDMTDHLREYVESQYGDQSPDFASTCELSPNHDLIIEEISDTRVSRHTRDLSR